MAINEWLNNIYCYLQQRLLGGKEMPESTKVNDEKVKINILKSRDDPEPVYLEFENNNKIFVCSRSKCTWANGEVTINKLRERIEPWLTALVQSENFSVLVGSGISAAVQYLASDKYNNPMEVPSFQSLGETIEKAAEKSAIKVGRNEANIEDQMRIAYEIVAGFDHLSSLDSGEVGEKIKELKQEINHVLNHFTSSILEGERNLVSASEEKITKAVNYLVSFLMSFASRTGTRERLHLFTTNYDRILEVGADIAGIRMLDRFVGSVTPIFRSSRLNVDMHYNPPGIRGEPRYLEGVVKFTKLHGSIDWINVDRQIRRIGLPFGAKDINLYTSEASIDKVMIYPNAAKDRETADYPYVELFRDFSAAICRPNHTLVTYGYSFGDEHINRVIEDMLTIPSTHLVIISYDDLGDRIVKLYERVGRSSQITLLVGNHFGNLKSLVDNYLPKPAIDNTTFSMSELLKIRLGLERIALRNHSLDSERGGAIVD